MQKPPIRLLIMGDSMTQGLEGDWTWRYRLWEWLRQQRVSAQFVGPWLGTQDPTPIDPPEGDPGPRVTGGYSLDCDAEYKGDGNTNHYSTWGRALAFTRDIVKEVVAEHQPDILLVMLGFNDMGWYISNADGTLESMEIFVRNARAAKPDLQFAIANVPQRQFMEGREDLVENTDKFNGYVKKLFPEWSTKKSPIKLVPLRETYESEPEGCPAAYDGLHPNALGDFEIAKAFSHTLVHGYGIGKKELQVPAKIPLRKVHAPKNVKVVAVDNSIVMTWDRVYGARTYDISKRFDGSDEWDLATQDPEKRTTGAIELTDGQRVFYKVRVHCGTEVTSAWSETVSCIARVEKGHENDCCVL